MSFLLKKMLIFSLYLVSASVYGMQQEPKKVMSFAQALMKADMGYGIDWLEDFVACKEGLNEVCSSTGMYPLAHIISGRLDSSLVTTGICNGAAVHLQDKELRNLFHCVARCPKTGHAKEYAYVPKKNLLSALALPRYNYPANVVAVEGALEIPVITLEEKLQASKERVKTVLLCLNRPELCALKPVKLCILAHLVDDIYSESLFARVIEQKLNIQPLIANCPIEWFQAVAQTRTGDDRGAFISKFAPLIARYRLERAQEVLLLKDKSHRTAYQVAHLAVEFLQNDRANNYSQEVIGAAKETVNTLEPIGFIERSMPECTKVVANVLEKKDPFDGFEF